MTKQKILGVKNFSSIVLKQGRLNVSRAGVAEKKLRAMQPYEKQKNL